MRQESYKFFKIIYRSYGLFVAISLKILKTAFILAIIMH